MILALLNVLLLGSDLAAYPHQILVAYEYLGYTTRYRIRNPRSTIYNTQISSHTKKDTMLKEASTIAGIATLLYAATCILASITNRKTHVNPLGIAFWGTLSFLLLRYGGML